MIFRGNTAENLRPFAPYLENIYGDAQNRNAELSGGSLQIESNSFTPRTKIDCATK